MKICARCKQEKDESDFYTREDANSDGYRNNCKKCHKEISYISKTPEKKRIDHLMYSHGLTIHEYNQLHKKQNGGCAICGKQLKVLRIDHNHKTGVISGLLCHECNTGLGSFGDNLELLRKAVHYLENQPQTASLEQQLFNLLKGKNET